MCIYTCKHINVHVCYLTQVHVSPLQRLEAGICITFCKILLRDEFGVALIIYGGHDFLAVCTTIMKYLRLGNLYITDIHS
jgi:hypothetical protein